MLIKKEIAESERGPKTPNFGPKIIFFSWLDILYWLVRSLCLADFAHFQLYLPEKWSHGTELLSEVTWESTEAVHLLRWVQTFLEDYSLVGLFGALETFRNRWFLVVFTKSSTRSITHSYGCRYLEKGGSNKLDIVVLVKKTIKPVAAHIVWKTKTFD